MIGKIEFKRRRDFGQVINDTFTFMRQNFKPLIKTYFTFCGLFVLASMSSMLVYQYKMVNIINTFGNGNLQGYDFNGAPSVRSYDANLRVTF